MSIPTNADGLFVAVDGNGSTIGHGSIAAGVVTFTYGPDDGLATVLPEAEFEATWNGLHLAAELRAAP